MGNRDNAIDYAKKLEDLCMRMNAVSKELYQQYGVKRGLRDRKRKGCSDRTYQYFGDHGF